VFFFDDKHFCLILLLLHFLVVLQMMPRINPPRHLHVASFSCTVDLPLDFDSRYIILLAYLAFDSSKAVQLFGREMIRSSAKNLFECVVHGLYELHVYLFLIREKVIRDPCLLQNCIRVFILD